MHARHTRKAERSGASLRLAAGYAALLILLCASSRAVTQPPDEATESVPLLSAETARPACYAVLTLASAGQPLLGGYACCALLQAGEHPWIAAWTFEEARLGPRETTAGAAAALFGLGTAGHAVALDELGLVLAGAKDCWRFHDPNAVQPLSAELLRAIRDGKLVSSKTAGGREFEAFAQAVTLAHETAATAFARVARHDVGFANLFRTPASYRGDVIHVEGRLRLLQKDEAPAMLKLAGIANLYFAWVFDDVSGGNPYCVVVTEPPADLPLNVKLNRRVTCDGYFFMNREYKAQDSKKPGEYRVAPLLIGRQLEVPAVALEPGDTAAEWPRGMLWGFLGLAAGVMLFVGSLAYWFGWNDARVRRRLTATRSFVVPVAESEEPAEWRDA